MLALLPNMVLCSFNFLLRLWAGLAGKAFANEVLEELAVLGQGTFKPKTPASPKIRSPKTINPETQYIPLTP